MLKKSQASRGQRVLGTITRRHTAIGAFLPPPEPTGTRLTRQMTHFAPKYRRTHGSFRSRNFTPQSGTPQTPTVDQGARTTTPAARTLTAGMAAARPAPVTTLPRAATTKCTAAPRGWRAVDQGNAKRPRSPNSALPSGPRPSGSPKHPRSRHGCVRGSLISPGALAA